jgi:hypothetical protein
MRMAGLPPIHCAGDAVAVQKKMRRERNERGASALLPRLTGNPL